MKKCRCPEQKSRSWAGEGACSLDRDGKVSGKSVTFQGKGEKDKMFAKLECVELGELINSRTSVGQG